MSIKGRPVHRLVACAARPRGVAASVAEARLVSDEHLAGAELVTVRAVLWRAGDPLAVRGQYEVAKHACKRRSARHPWGCWWRADS
jgi:hypothetical protein